MLDRTRQPLHSHLTRLMKSCCLSRPNETLPSGGLLLIYALSIASILSQKSGTVEDFPDL